MYFTMQEEDTVTGAFLESFSITLLIVFSIHRIIQVSRYNILVRFPKILRIQIIIYDTIYIQV